MGFDGIVSQAIMFIAVLGASALLVASFSDQVSDTTNSMTTQQNALAYQIKTSINIENVFYNSTSQYVTFYARNTGTTALITPKLSIYVGTLRIPNANKNVTVTADTTSSTNLTVWDPAEVVMGNLSTPLTVGTQYTLRIVTQYETADTFDFTA